MIPNISVVSNDMYPYENWVLIGKREIGGKMCFYSIESQFGF